MHWEYRTMDMTMDSKQQQWDAALHALGADGWQLSGTVPIFGQTTFGIPATKGARLIFMRPAPGAQSRSQP